MEPCLILPFYDSRLTHCVVSDSWTAGGALLRGYSGSNVATPPRWAVTIAALLWPIMWLIGPNDQSENEEENQDDLELENDEDTTKLRSARARPGAEDGSTAARGEDGTINPPFP